MCSEFLGDFHYVSRSINLEVKKLSHQPVLKICANVKFFKTAEIAFEPNSTHDIKSI